MEDLKALALQVLDDARVMSLGTVDEGGEWVADVVFVHDGLDIYWISDPVVRHSMAIAKNKDVAATIDADDRTDHERALQLSGEAMQVESVPDSILELLVQKMDTDGTSNPRVKLAEGLMWYKLVPNHIELIHNELFGYDRKKVI